MTRHLPTAALFAATTLLSGCLNTENNPGGPVAGSEEEAIQSVMFEEMAEYTDTEVRYVEDGTGAALAPIDTHRWYREVQNVSRTIEVVIEQPGDAPPTADVTMSGEVTGLLHLWAGENDELVEITKDFQDAGTRSLFFEKVRRHTPRHRGWKLQAISGVEIASAGTTRQINSVRIQAGDVDETITSVSELIALEDILRLPAGVEVTITVDTGDATDAVFLHLRHRFRQALTSNGDGTFTGGFSTDDARRGPRHLVIDVLSDGTLFDDTEAYDNVAWGYPFAIRGQIDEAGDNQ